jgi:sarcosine oxidase, subunit delta
MLTVHCPHCGARPETEFKHGGHAGIRRPFVDAIVSDEAFANYLFDRPINGSGVLDERWCHVSGCALWFTARRNLRSDNESRLS